MIHNYFERFYLIRSNVIEIQLRESHVPDVKQKLWQTPLCYSETNNRHHVATINIVGVNFMHYTRREIRNHCSNSRRRTICA